MQLAFQRGLLTGTHWAMQLLKPLSMAPRPSCPYRPWRPLRRLCWHMGFRMGVWHTLHGSAR